MVMDMAEGSEWLKSIYDEEGSQTKKERPHCIFAELGSDDETKACWFKASPQVCFLCLMGELIQILGNINATLKEIEDVRT